MRFLKIPIEWFIKLIAAVLEFFLKNPPKNKPLE